MNPLLQPLGALGAIALIQIKPWGFGSEALALSVRSLPCPENIPRAGTLLAGPKIHQILQRSLEGMGTMITAPGGHPGGEELSLKPVTLPSPFF